MGYFLGGLFPPLEFCKNTSITENKMLILAELKTCLGCTLVKKAIRKCNEKIH